MFCGSHIITRAKWKQVELYITKQTIRDFFSFPLSHWEQTSTFKNADFFISFSCSSKRMNRPICCLCTAYARGLRVLVGLPFSLRCDLTRVLRCPLIARREAGLAFEIQLSFLFSPLLLPVAAVAPAAAAGVSPPPPLPPSFLLPYHCSTAALSGSHSIVLQPPSPKGALVDVGAAWPAPAHKRDRFQIAVILGTSVPGAHYVYGFSVSPFLPGQSTLLSAADRRHLVTAGLPAWAALETKPPDPASSVCQRLSLSLSLCLATLILFYIILHFHNFITTLMGTF